MRAKSVNEEVNFERGQDPKDALGIGGEDKKLMKVGIDAFTHFLYYANGTFIRKIWGDKAFGDHMESKLRGNIGDGYMDPNALMRFIRDLDKGNQDKLYDYIIQNHTNKW